MNSNEIYTLWEYLPTWNESQSKKSQSLNRWEQLLYTTENEISVVPNPTTGITRLNFTGKVKFPMDFEVFDGSGKLVQEGVFRDNSHELDLRLLETGYYFLRIKETNSRGYINKKITLVR